MSPEGDLYRLSLFLAHIPPGDQFRKMTRVPHISGLFREMWEITELSCPLSKE
jgi:hypothetical protein